MKNSHESKEYMDDKHCVYQDEHYILVTIQGCRLIYDDLIKNGSSQYGLCTKIRIVFTRQRRFENNEYSKMCIVLVYHK